jgi:hypothetical protein
MNAFSQSMLSLLLLFAFLRGVFVLPLPAEANASDEASVMLWQSEENKHSADDSPFGALPSKKDENEGRKEKEEEGKEKEERIEEHQSRRKSEAVASETHTIFEFESLIDHEFAVAFHALEIGYQAYHAVIGQKMYLRTHALKIPC